MARRHRSVHLTPLVLFLISLPLSAQERRPERDRSLPHLAGAQVTIPWSEVKALMERTRALERAAAAIERPAPPPRTHILGSARYRGVVGETSTRLAATLDVELLVDGWHTIPIIGAAPTIVSATIAGKPARLLRDEVGYQLIIAGRGQRTIELVFELPLGTEVGDSWLGLRLAPFPRNSLDLVIPRTAIAVKVTPAGSTHLEEDGAVTRVRAAFPQTENLRVDWTVALPEQAANEEERAMPRCDVDQLVSIGGGLMKLDARVTCALHRGKIDHLDFRLPAATSLLEVTGGGVRHHRVLKEKDGATVTAFLTKATSGIIQLQVRAEKALSGTSAVAAIPKLELLGVERESGYVGVTATTNVEIGPAELEGMTPIDTKELPSQVWRAALHPILLSYKYLKHPWTLVIDIKRHEDLPVISSTIDSAWMQTFQTEDGKRIHSVLLQIKNTHKQFVKIELPEGAKILGAFVSAEPVKPATDQQRHILIPLEKSGAGEAEQRPFPVELVYLEEARSMGWLGRKRGGALKVDIPISVFHWSLYLPDAYTYWGFDGDLRPTDTWQEPPSVNRGAARRRVTRGTQARTMNDTREATVDTGLLPVRIDIPTTGQRFSFVKELVMVDDRPPRLTYRYVGAGFTRTMRGLLTLAGVLAAIISGLALVAVRRGDDPTRRLARLRRSIILLLALVAFDTYLFGPSIPSIASILIAAVICFDAHTSAHKSASATPDPA